MAASREPTMTNAKVKQNSKVTVDEFFKDFFTGIDLAGGSAAYNGPDIDSVSSQGDWLQVVNRGLTNLLKKRPENNKIFNWIERYVAETQKKHPEFIRALVTIICQNAVEGEGQGRYIDPKILKQRAPVLQRYIDNKRPLELHALYAVQAFDHSLHSQLAPGLLRISFGVLYDEDVCSEESFYDWKGGKQPNYPVNTVETKLLTSDKAWKPRFKRPPDIKTKDDDEIKTAELFRNITSILNKLTPQLFTKLTDKALQLPIDTEERLKGVISLVFEKALHEPNFSTAYAHMCQKLSQLKVQSVTTPGQQVQFRPILVHNCQQEFEKEKQTEIDEAQRRKEIAQLPANQQEAQLELLQEKLFKAKRRTMGNIRFIGELYKLRILTENIMHNCVMKLLKAKDDESLECLCGLMENIGKDLDHIKAKNRMDQYFNKIDKIIASQKNAPKIRFLMYDLVDQRKNKWVPRKQKSIPTTIDALHKEWHLADDGWNTLPTTLKITMFGPGGRRLYRCRGTLVANTKNQSPADLASSWRRGGSDSYGSRDSRGRDQPLLISKRPSIERQREKEAAIAEVQRISRGRPSRPEQPEARVLFRREGREIEKKAEPTMTNDKVKQTSKATVDEYLNLRDFNGVEFTIDCASAADNGLNSVSSQGDWLQVFNRGLTELLNKRPDNNKIFDWIEHNVAETQKKNSEFIRALVTIICQNAAEGEGQGCRIDPEILKQRGPVLQRYIDNKRPLELQALYAVQALNHSIHNPPGLLRILFDVLYDKDVVSEESFHDWKAIEDPKESAGKGVALKSVTSFFTWLAEAD